MLEFLLGIIVGCMGIVLIAILDVYLWKDKGTFKSTTLRSYLLMSGIEVILFIIGYIFGKYS